MSQMDKYIDIKEKVIRPALEELKKEYETLGFECSIGTQEPPSLRSKALSSKGGTPPTIRLIRPISLSRKQPNGISKTLSIFTWDGELIVFSILRDPAFEDVSLADITSDKVKEVVRGLFKKFD